MRRNPWISDVTDEDLVAQYEFWMRIRDKVDAAKSVVIAIRGLKAQLDERLEAADDDETLIAAAEPLRTVASVEADIYQVRNRSNQHPLNFPIKVNNLLSMSERGMVGLGAGCTQCSRSWWSGWKGCWVSWKGCGMRSWRWRRLRCERGGL